MGAEKICNGLNLALPEESGDNGHDADIILSSSISVDLSLPLPAMSPFIIELCKDLFKKWSKLDDSRFAVETVSGGITNLLLKVSVKEENGDEKSVTVRLYGPNTDYVINRERELLAIKYLSAAGFGAKLLGVFRNGMVQSFINARTLTPSDMRKPKLAAEIAKQLSKFHQVKIPGSKEPQLWNDVFKFYEKASSLQFDDSGKQSIYDTISFKEIRSELLEITELAGLLNSPVVFAHNDLLSGNLMLNDEEVTEALTLVTISTNMQAMTDYSLYPTKDQQFHFFRHYLQPEKPHEVSHKDLEALYIESNTFMLASHLYWALWALIQISYSFHSSVSTTIKLWAKMSPIDFDYIGYLFLRYAEYKKQKEKYCSLARSFLAGSGSSSGSRPA